MLKLLSSSSLSEIALEFRFALSSSISFSIDVINSADLSPYARNSFSIFMGVIKRFRFYFLGVFESPVLETSSFYT